MAEDRFFGGLKVAPLLVSEADVRFRRGAVVRVGPAPSVLVPAGTPGSFLVVHTAKRREGNAVRIVRTAAWLLEEHSWVQKHLPAAFFSGSFPEYDLTLVADRQRLLATTKRLSASAPRFSDAVPVPDFLTTPVGIMTVIRKLPDRDALLKFLNLHSKRSVWPSPANVLEWINQRTDSFTLKPIDSKVKVLRSKDGTTALYPVWALSAKVKRDIEHCVEPLPLHKPVYNDFFPYNADPTLPPEMTNKEAFDLYVARWEERMARYTSRADVEAYFSSLGPASLASTRKAFREIRAEGALGGRGVTTVLEVNYLKMTSMTDHGQSKLNLSLLRKLVANFLLAKAAEDQAPWWQNLLDGMPQHHRRIEQWAATLEETLDEEDERRRRDANFDPKNLPPCIVNAVLDLTHNKRVVIATIYKSVEKQNKPLAEVFGQWMLNEVASGKNGKQRRQELSTALRSKRLGPETMSCSMRGRKEQKPGCFSCPLGGNTVKCAFKRGITSYPDQKVSDVLVRSAEQLMTEMRVATLIEESMSGLPEDATSCDIAYDDEGRPVSVDVPLAKRRSSTSPDEPPAQMHRIAE